MKYETLRPNPTFNKQLTDFVREHGERRITDNAFQILKNGLYESAVVAHSPTGMVGFSAWDGDGKSFSVTVVHKSYRGTGIGTALVKMKPNLYTRLWNGNVASLIMCLKAGYIVIKTTETPTRTLLLLRKNSFESPPTKEEKK